eukprot:CCRYP_005310-RB/>CCRYP_005310-RB protein AED:0.46 eAED:1.00 QI:0/0/0/1/0/0/2/0/134
MYVYSPEYNPIFPTPSSVVTGSVPIPNSNAPETPVKHPQETAASFVNAPVAADAAQNAVPVVAQARVGKDKAAGPAERKPREVVATTRRDRRAFERERRAAGSGVAVGLAMETGSFRDVSSDEVVERRMWDSKH